MININKKQYIYESIFYKHKISNDYFLEYITNITMSIPKGQINIKVLPNIYKDIFNFRKFIPKNNTKSTIFKSNNLYFYFKKNKDNIILYKIIFISKI